MNLDLIGQLQSSSCVIDDRDATRCLYGNLELEQGEECNVAVNCDVRSLKKNCFLKKNLKKVLFNLAVFILFFNNTCEIDTEL